MNKSSWPNISIETYVSSEKHAYLVRDLLQVGSLETKEHTVEMLIEGDFISVSKVRSYTKVTTLLLNITKEIWRDGNDLEITESEYNSIVSKRYANWDKKSTTLNWFTEADLSSDLKASLKKSWDGFKHL